MLNNEVTVSCKKILHGEIVEAGKKYFISYNNADLRWAEWLAWIIKVNECTPFIHAWEVGAGDDIIKWMNDCLEACDHIISLFSPEYLKADFSEAELNFGIYQSITNQTNKVIPMVVNKCASLPNLISTKKRLILYDKVEAHAEDLIVDFLSPPRIPIIRPDFPGIIRDLQ